MFSLPVRPAEEPVILKSAPFLCAQHAKLPAILSPRQKRAFPARQLQTPLKEQTARRIRCPLEPQRLHLACRTANARPQSSGRRGKWQHLAFVTEPWGPWNPSTHLKNGRPSDINRKRPLKSFMPFCSPASGPCLPLLLLAFYKLWMRVGAAVPAFPL